MRANCIRNRFIEYSVGLWIEIELIIIPRARLSLNIFLAASGSFS